MTDRRITLATLVASIAIIWTMSPALAWADRYENTMNIYKRSPAVQPFFDDAYGYAVFPSIGKGGLIIGAAFGTGQVYRNGTPTGKTRLYKGTLGLQAGGQAFSEIIFFKDKRAYDDFIRGSFELDASATAVAITLGLQAKAGTQGATSSANVRPTAAAQAKNTYYKGMAVFTHTKGGFMYEASIGGQKFTFSEYDTRLGKR